MHGLFISTHDAEMFAKHKPIISKWFDKLEYEQSIFVKNGADNVIINKFKEILIKNTSFKGKYALFSNDNDNGLIEKFVDLCIQNQKEFLLYTTISNYPTFIKTVHIENYSVII